MEEHEIPVVVRGATNSPEDWAQVVRALPSDLPSLSQEEKERASRFSWDQRDYARRKLLDEIAEQRWKQKGQQLVSRIKETIKPVETEYRLEAVVAEIPRSRWTARFASSKGPYDVHLDNDLVDDLLDFNALEDAERLRRKLLAGLGEEKYVVSR